MMMKKAKVAKPQSNKRYQQNRTTQWSNLRQELLNLIISKLYFTDRVRFRAVCKDYWHLPIGDRPVNELLWIMNHTSFDHPIISVESTKVMLSDPVHKKTLTIPNFAGTRDEYMKCFAGSRICASKCGWLLLLANYKRDIGIAVFLHSPFTNNVIMLPILPAISNITPYYHEATFSSTNPMSPNCVFVVAHYCFEQCRVGISTYRNGDNEWRTKILYGDTETLYVGFRHSIQSLVCSEKGLCYFVLGCGKLGAFCAESQEWSWLVDSRWTLNLRDYMHLVEFNGDLFLARCPFEYHKWEWEVFRYDENERSWIEQKSLGDRALFIDSYGSYLRSAIGDTADLADKIFYINVSDIRVYSLQDGKQYKKTPAYDWIVNASLQKILIEPPY